MRSLGGLLVALLGVLISTMALAETRPFAHREVARDAERYERYVRENWKPGSRKAADLKLAADRQLHTDPRGAARSYATAATAEPKNPEYWLGLARALLAIVPDPNKGSERYDLPVNASGAAYRAYELATEPAAQARALAVLGEAMQRRSYWRPAIDALRASIVLVDSPDVRATYEKVRAEHGFRMTDYSTDSDAALPRVCIQFSENLARGQIDFAKFVAVDGRDPQGVTPEGQQLCVEGLTHGQRYELQIRAGLPSDVNETLDKPATIAVYVPDRKPAVRFSGKSYVLPTRGQQGIPLVSVNTTKVGIEVYRIGDRSLANALNNGELDRQLTSYDLETLRNTTGSRVYQGEMDVAQSLNAEVTTAFPVTDTVGALKPGAYAMVARPSESTEQDWRGLATQWFIVSDLGLTAFSGATGVHAFVRSLADTAPIANASVRLVAKNNEVLATATTDARGYARFDAATARGDGGLAPAILVAENAAGEYAFLDLTANAFDLSDRGVKGRDAPGPIDAFLYTERGVYRPGEEVNVTVLVRDANAVAADLPATLIVLRPDGVEYGRFPLTESALGGRTHTLALGGGAMTGTWRANLHTDPKSAAISQVSFLVEDYVPERLDLTLEASGSKLAPGEPGTVKVDGRFLYGPPAAGLAIEGDVTVKASKRDAEGFPGYQFGRAEEQIAPVRQTLENLPQTGADGRAKVEIALPTVTRTARPLEADVAIRLREPGGRTIERKLTLPVDLAEPRIGVKPGFDGGMLGQGEQATFDIVLIDDKGRRVTGKLDWRLVELQTSWQWYSRDGQWNYEAQTIAKKLATGTVEASADAPVQVATPVDYGRYRLEVTSPEPGGPATTVLFNAGWYASAEQADSPEVLDVALDKPSYAPGDTAKLRIASKAGGKALIAVLGSDLFDIQEVDLPKGGGDVEIKVGGAWGPGAYATALLYRPMDETAKRMPSRSIGVRWIGVDQAARTLGVEISAEKTLKSGAELVVPVKVAGLTAGEEARITVAAVDVGILNLTRFQAPAPDKHFYAQTKLGLEIRDFYGRLIDGMRAERGTVRSGGDGMGADGLQGSPPVEETVAFFSGIVPVSADGTAEARFTLPNFNGTVRVMAIAWSKDKVGHAASDVIVRDAVALTVSAPRFLTLGDKATVDVSLHNVELPAGNFAVTVTDATGEPAVVGQRTLALGAGERKSDRVELVPAEVGQRLYDVRVAAGDVEISRRLTFDVKPPAGDIKRTTVSAIKGNGGTLTLSKDLLAGLIANRTRVNLSVGPVARLDVPGLLTALDRYPYGCAEQTVSRALPLVYANAVAAQIGLAADKELRERVQAAINRVFEMQDSSGAFGSWGPGNTNIWLTAYVTDFLTRAKEGGFTVRQIPFAQALDRLQNFVSNTEDVQQGGEKQAYALYVLSRNGRAPLGELRYYADTRLDNFTTPLAKAQIGAALSMLGDKERAEKVFASAMDVFEGKATVPLARNDYGSDLRDGAAMVTLASETGIAPAAAPRLLTVVGSAYASRRYTSTQEQAWMLLAAHALGDQAKAANLAIDGAPVQGPVIRALTAAEIEKGVVITNNGEAPMDAVISVMGAALEPEPAIAKGLGVERSYFRLDGTPVDLLSAKGGKGTLAQNERLVAVVKVTSDEAAGRVLVVDRLPAGLEIENPRLVDGGDIKSLDWLKSDIRPEHSEFRDDRFVAAFDLSPKSNDEDAAPSDGLGTNDTAEQSGPKATATVAYIVRAVTPGEFVHPAATVEEMYRPERHARSAAGKLTVTVGK